MIAIKHRIIFSLLFVVGMISLVGLALQESQAQESIPEIDKNQGISEFRSDGIEIVHYQDGSKLYRVSVEDGMSSSDDLR